MLSYIWMLGSEHLVNCTFQDQEQTWSQINFMVIWRKKVSQPANCLVSLSTLHHLFHCHGHFFKPHLYEIFTDDAHATAVQQSCVLTARFVQRWLTDNRRHHQSKGLPSRRWSPLFAISFPAEGKAPFQQILARPVESVHNNVLSCLRQITVISIYLSYWLVHKEAIS